MTIKIVQGNLLNATEDLLVHQCNAKGFYNAGLAKQVRVKYPEAYESYIEHCNSVFPDDTNTLMGTVDVCRANDGKYIANLIGQLDLGRENIRYTSYDALFDGLNHIKHVCKENGMSVALPYGMGSVLGGASWNVVYAIIEDVFEDYEVTIYQLN